MGAHDTTKNAAFCTADTKEREREREIPLLAPLSLRESRQPEKSNRAVPKEDEGCFKAQYSAKLVLFFHERDPEYV